MCITKWLKVFLSILVISSCSQIKLDIPKNEVPEVIEHKGQKYLIPIPENYCRYDQKNKGDKAVINLINDSSNSLIALYEDCKTKELVLSGKLHDSPHSIQIKSSNIEDVEYATRKQLSKVVYDSISDKINTKKTKEFLTNQYEALTEKKLTGYGFSVDRAKMLREDFKGFAEKSNLKKMKRHDEYGAYEFRFISNNSFSSYTVEATTKLYNKTVNIIISRAPETIDYDANVAKQLLKESREYLREFVKINDKEDFRKYSYNNKKIKIYTPDNFLLLPNEEKKFLEGRYKKMEKFGYDFKEVVFESGMNLESDKSTATLAIAFLKLPFDQEKLSSRERFLDLFYRSSMELTQKYKSLAPLQILKRENGVLTISDKNEQPVVLNFTTLINGIPVVLMAEVTNKKKEISKKEINALGNEFVNYVQFLDRNQ